MVNQIPRARTGYLVTKRIMDILGASLGIILTSPILLITAMLIKIESPGPVFFKQRRIGKNKAEFHIVKFRSMYIESPKEMPTHLLSEPDAYITRVGRIIRKTSIDELPQLINVIKGEMSLVGPRPALWNQIDLISERDRYGVNDVLPGITGWAQVNGRDELSIRQKTTFDIQYLQKSSISFDLKCILLTIIKVIARKDVIEGKAKP